MLRTTMRNNQTDSFNPVMLVIARESRGLTQKDLAEKLSVTQGWLSRVESNLRSISEDVLQKLSDILDYPIEFFYQTDPIYGFGPSELFNRRRQDVPAKRLEMIHAQINISRIHLARMLRGVEIGNTNIPNFELGEFNGNVDDIARAIRAMWHIPPGPINNLTKIIEDNGGIIIPFDFGTSRIDAMSLFVPGTPPLFFINMNSPGDRVRFTLCHELAHIVMHQRDINPDMEKQADRFAAQFLMPEKDIRPYLRNLSFPKLADLKLYWKVSMAALLKRATDLGEITESQARSMWMRMSSLGYRSKEPPELDIPVEVPTLYQEIIDTYRNELGYSTLEFAKLLCIFEQEVKHNYFVNHKRFRVVK